MRQIDDLVHRAILVLAASRQFNTADIAEMLLEREDFVVWLIDEAKAGRVSFATACGIDVITGRQATPFGVSPASEGA